MWVTNTTQTQLFLTPPPPPITFFFPVTLSEILIFHFDFVIDEII